MTEHKLSVTCAIASNPCEFELLESVYQLLKNGNVFGTSQSSNIVDFKYPEELKVTLIQCKIYSFITHIFTFWSNFSRISLI